MLAENLYGYRHIRNIEKSNLGTLEVGDSVNLERGMKLGDRGWAYRTGHRSNVGFVSG